ncbi:hypothetical protein CTI12_AA363620 [Artemisia annua]|uniref:Uncharacterized protein n=1 Tax=Artemisia annua TaxID=35608 RepID=A0A2U1MMM5_ARTAN|nr:hypothetical protein CTI12_AA363620 [Artemisia annua]
MTSSSGDTTVFIDTNLKTFLVTMVSDSVTVSDLKRIIVSEHRQCFPAIGNIKIDGLKVKRRGSFYRMSDSMRVKGAFAANKDNWFISVDASRLEQTCGVQHVDKDKAGDRIALPWVTDNHSIDQGSPSMPPKIVPFVNPEVSNVGQITIADSLKGCQKNTEKDRPSNNKISSKKRTRAEQNSSLLEDASGSGPSVKKKRRTQKKESTVKASENLGNVNTIISINKLSENSSVQDQVVTVVPSGVVDIGEETPLKNAEASETVPEISLVLEKNIQQEVPSEVSQKDKDKELVQKTVAGSEIPSSSMRTSDCEPDTSALSHQKGAKSSTKRKAAEKEVAATSLIKTQHNINTDATDLSKKDLGSTVKESAGVETDNREKDKETSLIQEPEVKLPVKKKKVKKPAAKNKDETQVKRADNIVSETSSIVPATTVDEKINGETKNDKVSLSNAKKNEGLEKTLTDVTMQEAETSKPTEVVVETSKSTEVVAETLKPTEVVVETSKKDLKDVVGSRKTKKDVGKSATRTDAATVTNKEELLPHSEMKDSQDITSIDALHVDHGSKEDIVTNNDAGMSKTEKTTSQVNAEGIDEKSEKQNEKMDDKKVKRKKRKTKKSANNGEGSMSTAVSVPPLYDESRYPKMALLHAAIEDVDQMKGKNEHVFDEGLVKKALKSKKSSVTAPEDLPSKRQSTEPDVEPENIDHQTSKNLTVSEVSKNKDEVSNEVNISKDGSHEIDFLKSFTPGKDTTQSVKEKKPKKTKEPSLVDSRNDSAMQSKKLASKNENKKAPTNVVNGSNIPNTDQFKTPKKISKIDASRTSKLAHANKAHGKPSAESLLNQKSNKQQSTLSQSSVKHVQKSAPVKKSSQHIKSSLNKPGTIFDGDSDESSTDDNANANSDSSTRTPSGRSSSGDSTTSIESRRKGSHADKRKSVGKDSTNSQTKSKGMTMADLLRSSSRFKKAKVTASQQARDTESQSVDFVPESQP